MKIGVADTTFSRVDMASVVTPILEREAEVIRYTVPGFKDLPVACRKLFKEDNCDLVMALGWCGGMPVDKQCAHEASLGLQHVQVLECKHILEVFIHADESDNLEELKQIALNRAEKHAENALALLKGKTTLTQFAGKGRRQGKDDEGAL